ncbi:MAG: hypothetical protein ACTHMC_28145 [Pseudobacter sp.]|uniref:hypothetical protein n=1 Tax=Pseudobacter sp. TaxID=2045420 RepID=UPI003F7D22EC
MKIFYTGLVVSAFLSVSAKAQQAITVKQHHTPKPAVFTKFPGKFEVDLTPFRKAFASDISDTVSIRLSAHHSFRGVITDKVQHSPTLRTLNIKSAEFSGAMMFISLNTATDAEQPVNIRILHPRKADVMVLTQEAGKYFLVKEEQQFFLAE